METYINLNQEVKEGLIAGEKFDTIPVRDGYIICPRCRDEGWNVKLLQIRPDSVAMNIRLFCKRCKTEYTVDILRGQCFESRCP